MKRRDWLKLTAGMVFILGLAVQAQGLAILVVDSDGKPVTGFRYLVELDTTIQPLLNQHDPNSLGTNIHGSYSPVIASGHSYGWWANVYLDPTRRYYVSVLPDNGYTLGGAQVAVRQARATVTVHKQGVPTAQISIHTFEDNRPLNNAPDIPTERALPGFNVLVFDQFGQVMKDAYDNMLGTTYMTNPDGSIMLDENGDPVVDMPGTGVVLTDANGEAIIKHMNPGKYGIRIVPPRGEDWVQTTTIEGTPGIDVWVGPNGPTYLNEFGLFFWHAFFGFVRPQTLPAGPGVVGQITGQAFYIHDNKPPLPQGVNPGRPVENAWVGLNNLSGADEMVYAQPCAPDGSFDIQNVPPGMYQLVIWDRYLDVIIDFRSVVVPPEGGLIALGPTPVFAWFGFLEGKIFHDTNANGVWDMGETPVVAQAVNLRFTDGSIYQASQTGNDGQYGFSEVFPWFFWIITEVDFLRYNATGVRVVVDDGGPLPPGNTKNNPQLQPENNNEPFRVEVGPQLLQAMLLYAGQTNEIDWGKQPYLPGRNGGISGIVFYAVTRAEDEPRQAAPDNWEPGVPRVQVALYMDQNQDGLIDDVNGDGRATLSDVDNWPFGWSEGGRKGPEDVSNNRSWVFSSGDAINVVWTDSWDDNLPDGVGPPQTYFGQAVRSGAETIRTWNQVRPGVFDGGYAITSYFPGGMTSGSGEVDGLPSGYYIVGVSPPPGYEIVKEEDKNVDFGNTHGSVKWPFTKPAFKPLRTRPARAQDVSGLTQFGDPPLPVGDEHLVPDELTLFGGVPCRFAGQWRSLCDRKAVYLGDNKNAACDFHIFTHVPKAARIWGQVFNDVGFDNNPQSPNASTNLGASWIPVAVRDWRGVEVARVYTDEWGRYNGLVPSSFTVSAPIPTGVSPNMLEICLNDPGPIPDPRWPYQPIFDPQYNARWQRVQYTLDFWSGKTTLCDTPVLPTAGFNGSLIAVDCAPPDKTPAILSVSGPQGGPYVMAGRELITIQAVGNRAVTNPDYNPANPGGVPATVVRDFGFGAARGTVTVGGVPLDIVRWTAASVVARVPVDQGTGQPTIATGQLMLTRGDNQRTTVIGVTLHVAPPQVVQVRPGQSIQAAIDAAAPGTLILIAPGTYTENLFLYKALTLQGWGAYSTVLISGSRELSLGQPDFQATWQARYTALTSGPNPAADLVVARRPNNLVPSSLAGILVLGKQVGGYTAMSHPKIDGLQVSFADVGGGIVINAFCHYTEISNNIVAFNQGNYGGGIRIGTPALTDAEQRVYVGSENTNIYIHHNHINKNGAIDGGGGVAIWAGTDDYRITHNWICGNFSLLYGGGIAHHGKSLNGTIAFNKIYNNEAFDEGGGLIIAGDLVPANALAGTLSEGSGSVTVNANLIQGNMSGDDGGGIRLLMPNGEDVRANPSTPAAWYTITILNNLIVNNSTADAGGGLSLDDAAQVFVIHNTIAHNDSLATSVDAFGLAPVLNNPPGQWLDPANIPIDPATSLPATPGSGLFSVPQAAGIASRAHSTGLAAAFGAGFEQTFTNPVLSDNVIWQNRSFYWDYTLNGGVGGLKPDVGGGEPAQFWDLAVYGTPAIQVLNPTNCVLTQTTYTLPGGAVQNYDATNVSANPNFLAPYFNVNVPTAGGQALGLLITNVFSPLGLRGDYHLGAGSGASNVAGAGILFPQLNTDIDGQARPAGAGPDAGADEVNQ